METRIERIGPAQTGLLDKVAEDVFDAPIHPGRLADFLADPGHLMVLAVSDGEVVGQARGMIHRNPDEPPFFYIDNLGVTPARKREGLATRMLDDLVAWARSEGCEGAWVATETDNLPAKALYEGRGAETQTMAYFEYEFDDT